MTAAARPLAPADANAPRVASRLAYAGLIPFVLGALLVWLVYPDVRSYASAALSLYAGAVVAFLGGIHWGIGFRDGDRRSFAWGVVPALVAWPAALMPSDAGLVVHGVMLVVCYLVDRRLYPAHGLQDWLTLRFRLSAVAALSCFIGAAGA